MPALAPSAAAAAAGMPSAAAIAAGVAAAAGLAATKPEDVATVSPSARENSLLPVHEVVDVQVLQSAASAAQKNAAAEQEEKKEDEDVTAVAAAAGAGAGVAAAAGAGAGAGAPAAVVGASAPTTTLAVRDIDRDTVKDVTCFLEYVSDVFAYLRELQVCVSCAAKRRALLFCSLVPLFPCST